MWLIKCHLNLVSLLKVLLHVSHKYDIDFDTDLLLFESTVISEATLIDMPDPEATE